MVRWSEGISAGVELFGTRSHWTDKEEEESIEEPGQPSPLPASLSNEAYKYRVSFVCPRESACLTVAASNKWKGFSCFQCDHRRGESLPPPIDIGVPHSEQSRINGKLRSRAFVEGNSLFDYCDCGKPKLRDMEGCRRCLGLDGKSRNSSGT